MDLNVTFKIDDQKGMDMLATLIAKKLSKDLPSEQLKFETRTKKKVINFDEFRKIFCHGKGKEWVKEVLFKQYPEIVDPNRGFVSNFGAGRGKHIKVNFYEAEQWFKDHDSDIEWNQPNYAV